LRDTAAQHHDTAAIRIGGKIVMDNPSGLLPPKSVNKKTCGTC
jgi:hypothetical protein